MLMKVLVVRVSGGRVSVEGKVVSSIDKGLAIFVGIEKEDSNAELVAMAEKIVNLRIFENEKGKMNYSLKDKNYQILCISNFTLCANTNKGRRPSFEGAASPDRAKLLFEDFIKILQAGGVRVEKGVFGEKMNIDLQLDGPVNIILG